jgi:hypothetical protein
MKQVNRDTRPLSRRHKLLGHEPMTVSTKVHTGSRVNRMGNAYQLVSGCARVPWQRGAGCCKAFPSNGPCQLYSQRTNWPMCMPK